MSGPILVTGASSGIGRAVARRLAALGHPLVLAARDRAELERERAHLALASGVDAAAVAYDASLEGAGRALWRDASAAAGAPLEGLVVCTGEMTDEDAARGDLALARRMIAVNYASVVELCETAARELAARGAGFVCVVGSVAGDRGRAANYLYGSTKAAVEAFAEGLRARLAPSGVAVVLVKPGLVDTRLAWGHPGAALAAPPERVARAVARAIAARRPVIYTPWWWRWVMLAIRLLPRPVLRRLPI